jgi:hypothetical protein
LHQSSPRPDTRPRATTPAEAESLVAEALAALEDLEPLIVEETRRLGEGHVRDALALSERKGAAARRYGLALETIKGNAVALGRFRPPSLALLRRRHEAFAAELDLNMAVISTARTVSESLVRELATDVAQARSPQGYGAGGQGPGGYRTPVQPLAVARSA